MSGSSVSGSFVFGVDLDGVCADYTRGFREIVAEHQGVDPETLTLERSWGFQEWGIDDAAFNELHRFAVTERHLLRDLPQLEGCADALWRLSDAGIWIRIITHRLYTNWGHAAAIGDTVTWLDNAQVPYRDICFLGAKPEVEADAYIDDAPHNIEALRAAGNDVIVFEQPYNRHLDGPRARNWDEVEEIVMALAALHHSAHDRAIQPQLPGIDAGADRLMRRKNFS